MQEHVVIGEIRAEGNGRRLRLAEDITCGLVECHYSGAEPEGCAACGLLT
jgi:hypothetical protein